MNKNYLQITKQHLQSQLVHGEIIDSEFLGENKTTAYVRHIVELLCLVVK